MPKFRKKPVTIEAVQLTSEIQIPTKEGVMTGGVGDWLITGIKQEQYPCKDDIFRDSYHPVDAEAAAALGVALPEERATATPKVNWNEILDIGEDLGKDLLELIKPYLPALSREGKDVYDGFIKHLVEGDFSQIDALMYAKMTVEERRELENQVYKDAYAAVESAARRRELYKEIAFKVMLRLLLRFAI